MLEHLAVFKYLRVGSGRKRERLLISISLRELGAAKVAAGKDPTRSLLTSAAAVPYCHLSSFACCHGAKEHDLTFTCDLQRAASWLFKDQVQIVFRVGKFSTLWFGFNRPSNGS